MAQTLSYTVEQEVLLLCARTRLEGTAPERLRQLLDQPLDWEALLSLTAGHHTSALLYHHISSVAPNKVPPATLESLRAYHFHLAARNLRVVGESIPILQELEAAGAPAVVWKGPALAYSVYPNPELRTFTDLDILVRRRDLRVLRGVLSARGYRPRHPPAPSEDELFSRRSEVVSMWSAEAEIGVDVHWGSTGRYSSSVMDCERLWLRGEGLSLGGSWVRSLELESMLLALCAHGAKHGPHPWPILKWVTDLEAILRVHPPDRWGAILTRSRELGCHRMLLVGLNLARDLLEAPLPPEVATDLANDVAATTLALPICERILNRGSQSFTFSERLRFDLAVRERRRDRIAYGLDKLLTPNEQDLPATPRPLWLLRVPWRLFRLARRYLLSPSRGRVFLLGSGEKGDSSDG